MAVTIRTATREDAAIVGELAYRLVREISPGGPPTGAASNNAG